MRQLARKRRAKTKAEAEMPQWIKDADAANPDPHLDLGWRPLPP
jgi:hypothetical protein